MKLLLGLSLWTVYGGVVVVGAASESSSTTRKLDQTPTWAVASVCAVIIIISILLEKILHKVGTWFTEKHKKALFEALEKVKAGERRRALLWFDHRFLSSDVSAAKCKDGYEQLISVEGLHELHILIFFLAIFHVIFSVITMTLGRLKSRAWKRWELETLSHDYEFSHDPSRFRLTHETSFVRAHTGFGSRIPFFFYIVHLAPGSKFDFRRYIKRSLEDDFKLVVGVSPILWASFVIFLLLNVNGWQAMFWASVIPVINAFQITYFLWVWYTFGLKSCFHENFNILIAKIALGVGALFLCSYSTLPLYALVTQMGSRMKRSVFDEQTSKALKKWHMAVKKRHGKGGKTPTRTLGSASPSVSTVSSSHTLKRFKTTGHSTQSAYTYDGEDASDLEAEALSPTTAATSFIVRVDDDSDDVHGDEVNEPQHEEEEARNEDEFSFVKPAPPKDP
ncbi:MLO-LIKE PROTEIN 1 [Salix viminalis]|uniref:MLO-like protein n=1 Tax=Salix viminalis TaxID=40686 RepID=A0A9Q0UVT6_SALVM|nr:MLO-LIKE PROTEIN 1 [Salix viminalis]